MRARDKYSYGSLFEDFAYQNGGRMARVRETLFYEPTEIRVTFYKFDGIWLVDHEETGFEFGFEAFERGIEWVDEGSAA